MSQQWKNSETGADDDVQMPLGVGGDGAAPEESYVEKRPKMNSSTLALFATFAAALVVLYLLGLQNKPRHVNAAMQQKEEATNTAIDELIQKGGGSAKGLQWDIQRLVTMLTRYLGTRQTASLDVGGNPFERDVPVSSEPSTPSATSFVPVRTEEAAGLRKAAETFNGLKLQSVMIGANPAALVNNKMVTVGAKFGDLTVTAIEAHRVLLKYKDNTFELKPNSPSMEQP